VEEVAIEVMYANKAIELFQTMDCEYEYGEFNFKVNSLKTRLAIREKEKAIL
jgi:hypothetical protein